MARSEAKIKEGAAALLEPGEEVLAAIVARPRGWTQARASAGGGAAAGAIGGALGGRKQRASVDAAQQAGFGLASPMALAVTGKRLLSLKVTAPIGLGIGMKVQELVSAVPLADVDSIDIVEVVLECESRARRPPYGADELLGEGPVTVGRLIDHIATG